MFFLQGISEMLQQKNVRLDETQVCEAAELRRKLQSELELLMAYQVSLFEKIDFRRNLGCSLGYFKMKDQPDIMIFQYLRTVGCGIG